MAIYIKYDADLLTLCRQSVKAVDLFTIPRIIFQNVLGVRKLIMSVSLIFETQRGLFFTYLQITDTFKTIKEVSHTELLQNRIYLRLY